MGVRENKIENYIHDAVTELGGTTRKWVSPARAGVPDRIVILPWTVFFVEVKVEGEKAKPHQVREHNRLREAGATVLVVSGYAEADKLIKELKNAATTATIT